MQDNLFTLSEVHEMIREVIKKEGMPLAETFFGVFPGFLNSVLNENRDPGPRVLAALGLDNGSIYYRKVNRE